MQQTLPEKRRCSETVFITTEDAWCPQIELIIDQLDRDYHPEVEKLHPVSVLFTLFH